MGFTGTLLSEAFLFCGVLYADTGFMVFAHWEIVVFSGVHLSIACL